MQAATNDRITIREIVAKAARNLSTNLGTLAGETWAIVVVRMREDAAFWTTSRKRRDKDGSPVADWPVERKME